MVVNARAFRQSEVNAVARFVVCNGSKRIAFIVTALLVVAPARNENACRFFIIANLFILVGFSVVNVDRVKLNSFAFDKFAAFSAGGCFPVFAIEVAFKSCVAAAVLVSCYKAAMSTLFVVSLNMIVPPKIFIFLR